jgi:hypothetical protein
MELALKKVFSVVLAVIFIYNISGYYFIFLIQQSENRDLIQYRLKTKQVNDLVLIKLENENCDIEWENENEFSLDGKMYDVAFKVKKGSSNFLYCYNDSKEESLFTSVKNHISNHLDQNAPNDKSKAKEKGPLMDFIAEFANNLTINNLITFNPSVYRLALNDFKTEFPDPPPQII